MKRIINDCESNIVSSKDVESHSVIGLIDLIDSEGGKCIVAQVSNDVFRLFVFCNDGTCLNRYDDNKYTWDEIMNNLAFEKYLFDTQKECLMWLVED